MVSDENGASFSFAASSIELKLKTERQVSETFLIIKCHSPDEEEEEEAYLAFLKKSLNSNLEKLFCTSCRFQVKCQRVFFDETVAYFECPRFTIITLLYGE